MDEPVRLISWNIGGHDLWSEVVGQPADIALLQEARIPVTPVSIDLVPEANTSWKTSGWEKRDWGVVVACLSDRVELRPRQVGGVDESRDHLMVSRPGTLAAADVYLDGALQFTAVSMYAPWERPPGEDKPIYADASAHRLLSDLAGLVRSARGHRVIAAGDLNILHGYGEHGDPYWGARYRTVFDRAEAMGLRFVGPQHPNGRQANPWPKELPADSKDVPTFHHNRQTPETATRQMDFVFASNDLASRVQARALNQVDEWGPSDHCRVLIEVQPG